MLATVLSHSSGLPALPWADVSSGNLPLTWQKTLTFTSLVVWVMALSLSPITAARDRVSDPFTPLDRHIEQQTPDWWPQYQVVQSAIQDQRLEDARLLLEPLLKDHAEDEAAFQLLGPRYLWLTQAPDCAVLDALSETPAPWLSATQRFCRYLTERRQAAVNAASVSTLYSWYQWLFGIRTQQALLTEQALVDLEALQAQQPDSLTLVGLVSVLMQWRGASESDIEQFWQSQNPAEDVKRVAIYWQLTDVLAKRVWFEETPVKQGGWSFFGMQGAEAGAAEKDVDERGFLGPAFDLTSPDHFSVVFELPPKREPLKSTQDFGNAPEQPEKVDYTPIKLDFSKSEGTNKIKIQLRRSVINGINRIQDIMERQRAFQLAAMKAAEEYQRERLAAQKISEQERREQDDSEFKKKQDLLNAQYKKFKSRHQEILESINDDPIRSLEEYLDLLSSPVGNSVADRNQRIARALNELEFEISFEQAETRFFTECFIDANNALILFQDLESNFPDRAMARGVEVWINECQKKLDSISADLKEMGREYDRKKEAIYRRYGADPLGTLKAHLELLQSRLGGSISNQYEAIARVHRTMDDIREGRLWVTNPTQYEPEPGYLDSVWHWVWGQPTDKDDDLSMHDLAETGHCSTQGCPEPFINPLSDSVLMVAGAMPSAIDLNWSKGYYWDRFVQYTRHFAPIRVGWGGLPAAGDSLLA